MVFPATPRDLTVEILINETWTDITDYALQRQDIAIVRGSGGESDSAPPTTMTLLLNNDDGRFSYDNPMSPYWPYFNTACQIRLKMTEGGTDYYRFWGETGDAPEMTNQSRDDQYITLECHGLFGRWERSKKPESPLRRSIMAGLGTDLVAYWPMEDGGENDQTLADLTPNTQPMFVNSEIDFASNSDMDGTLPIPDIGSGQVTANVPAYRSTDNAVSIGFVMSLSTVASDGTTVLSCKLYGGTVGRVALITDIDGDTYVRFYDRDGAIITTTAALNFEITNTSSYMALTLNQSGADIHVEWEHRNAFDTSINTSAGTDITSQSLGIVSQCVFGYFNNLGAAIGHLHVHNTRFPSNITDIYSAAAAYVGESAGARFIRNCREASVEFRYAGQSLNAAMGPQPIDTLYAILRECADVEHALIYEARDFFGLTMITREALYNQGTNVRLPPDMSISTTSGSTSQLTTLQSSYDYRFWPGVTFQLRVVATDALVASTVHTVTSVLDDGTNNFIVNFTPAASVTPSATYEISIVRSAVLALDYSLNHLVLPFKPVRDNKLTANRVQVRRDGGSSAQVEDATSPRGTADPPEGIGLYETSSTLNVYRDATLRQHAGWLLGLGTNAEARFTELELNMANSALAAKQAEILTADIGHLVTIDNMSSAHIYQQARQHLHGYVETFDTVFGHRISLNTVPARPYKILTFDDAEHRWAAESTTLGAALTSSATGAVSVNAGRDVWTTDSSDFPQDIIIGGEQVTISGISGGAGSISFVSAGTSSAADNSSVTPGLPAGVANGNVVLILVAIRNTSATVNTPTNWTVVHSVGNHMKLLAREYQSGTWTTMPTITVSGGASGSTVIAQGAAFSGIMTTAAKTNTAVTTTNVDIPVRTSGMNAVHGQYGLRLACGVHYDDWASVIPPSGLDEIDEPDSALGSDMGVTWAYAIDAIAGNFPGTKGQAEFTITTTTAATNHSFVVFFAAAAQTFTISARSVNGVVKAHTVGTPIDIVEPSHYGL